MKDSGTVRKQLGDGLVIPAHPLALTSERRLDMVHQRALTRYYLASGAGGIAVGVHTTQFAIHDPRVGLYRPVLELAAEEVNRSGRQMVKVAGLVGATDQAVREAGIASDLGYDCGLLSLGALRDASDEELIEHSRLTAEVIPLFGFYLQPAIGGRVLSGRFWRRFLEIENVVAVKIAPFNRYQTLDVVRALADSGRATDIALYTGNDDSIILDLLTPFQVSEDLAQPPLRIAGGLLGQWAVWTRPAVQLLDQIRGTVVESDSIPTRLLELNAQLTDANAAIFDAENRFSGCLAGILEVLRRQGLVRGTWCIDPDQQLSPGQVENLDRIERSYPHLRDDDFVREHLSEWLS